MSAMLSLYFLFALFCFTSAFPITITDLPTAHLEKRVDHTGRGTWFDVGLGACGFTDVDSSHIVAISHEVYGSGGNCNQWMHITNNANGKSVYALTRDECMGCGSNDVDLSPSAFSSIGNLDTGVLDVTWHYMAKGWSP
ncbi:Non-catalytic module family EXPN protein [Abortiporus biennis]|nr:Non-catalytic module family EXPN protein [Abortiporus biennis]